MLANKTNVIRNTLGAVLNEFLLHSLNDFYRHIIILDKMQSCVYVTGNVIL